MPRKSVTITAALISGAAIVLAAVIGNVLRPEWWLHGPHPADELIIAGTVVDATTNQAVGQATVSVVGRTETYVTEDNGNFRIRLRGSPLEDGRVRIHVTKGGYRAYDEAISPPTESLVVPLGKL